jgi:hypothetical protein
MTVLVVPLDPVAGSGWEITFEPESNPPSGVRINWLVIERLALCTDGVTVMYASDAGMTDVRADAALLLHGQYRSDHNGERFFFDAPGQPDMDPDDVDAFARMLVAVRDRCREVARGAVA